MKVKHPNEWSWPSSLITSTLGDSTNSWVIQSTSWPSWPSCMAASTCTVCPTSYRQLWSLSWHTNSWLRGNPPRGKAKRMRAQVKKAVPSWHRSMSQNLMEQILAASPRTMTQGQPRELFEKEKKKKKKDRGVGGGRKGEGSSWYGNQMILVLWFNPETDTLGMKRGSHPLTIPSNG